MLMLSMTNGRLLKLTFLFLILWNSLLFYEREWLLLQSLILFAMQVFGIENFILPFDEAEHWEKLTEKIMCITMTTCLWQTKQVTLAMPFQKITFKIHSGKFKSAVLSSLYMQFQLHF